jgi:predicted cupin superfamily sugar epimerase
MHSLDYWIKHLNLIPHPEGGYYKEIYRSEEQIHKDHLPERFTGHRTFKTSIYYLINGKTPSKLHRIKSDELWHFYYGDPATVYVINPDGSKEELLLGSNPEKGEAFQAVVKAGSWFGAAVNNKDSYTLAGCTVAPGFDFEDFLMADREELLKEFPQHKELIEWLT